MFDAVEGLVAEHAELEGRLAAPETHADQRLAKRLNQRYAELSAIVRTWREWQQLGDDIGAQRAYEMGLIYKVVPAGDVQAEAEALAARFAVGPTRALAPTRQRTARAPRLPPRRPESSGRPRNESGESTDQRSWP